MPMFLYKDSGVSLDKQEGSEAKNDNGRMPDLLLPSGEYPRAFLLLHLCPQTRQLILPPIEAP